MYLNKKNLFLVISICLVFFFLTYNDVKSVEVKVIDGDTHDMRFKDPRNVVVGLKAKAEAKVEDNGFVIYT